MQSSSTLWVEITPQAAVSTHDLNRNLVSIMHSQNSVIYKCLRARACVRAALSMSEGRTEWSTQASKHINCRESKIFTARRAAVCAAAAAAGAAESDK